MQWRGLSVAHLPSWVMRLEYRLLCARKVREVLGIKTVQQLLDQEAALPAFYRKTIQRLLLGHELKLKSAYARHELAATSSVALSQRDEAGIAPLNADALRVERVERMFGQPTVSRVKWARQIQASATSLGRNPWAKLRHAAQFRPAPKTRRSPARQPTAAVTMVPSFSHSGDRLRRAVLEWAAAKIYPISGQLGWMLYSELRHQLLTALLLPADSVSVPVVVDIPVVVAATPPPDIVLPVVSDGLPPTVTERQLTAAAQPLSLSLAPISGPAGRSVQDANQASPNPA